MEDKVCEELKSIYGTIEQAKKKYTGLYILFITYALVQGISIIMQFAARLVLGADAITANINMFKDLILYIVMIFIFIQVYRKERNLANKYYISCISIWGIIATSFPIIFFLVRMMVLVFDNSNAIIVLPRQADYRLLINIILFCLAIIITGVVTERTWILLCAVIYLFFAVSLISLPDLSIDGSNSLINYILYIAGYISLGILLWKQEKKSGDI